VYTEKYKNDWNEKTSAGQRDFLDVDTLVHLFSIPFKHSFKIIKNLIELVVEHCFKYRLEPCENIE
jgi:hypothetical protein